MRGWQYSVCATDSMCFSCTKTISAFPHYYIKLKSVNHKNCAMYNYYYDFIIQNHEVIIIKC